jgi:hypothetical protein
MDAKQKTSARLILVALLGYEQCKQRHPDEDSP